MTAPDRLTTIMAKVDPRAWELASELGLDERAPARGALRECADRQWPTDLNVVLSEPQLAALTSVQRYGLRRLWREALRRQLRTEPVPLSSRERSAALVPTTAVIDPGVPTKIDAQAWALTANLRGSRTKIARGALKKLVRLGCATDLNVLVPAGTFAQLGVNAQLALRQLWTLAERSGARTVPTPSRLDAWLRRNDLVGVDEDVVAYARAQCLHNQQRAVRAWLRALRAAAVPTGFDLDLGTPAVRAVYTELMERAARRSLYGGKDEVDQLRSGIRRLYERATADGRRQRPIPPFIGQRHGYAVGSGDALVQRLPAGDHARITAVTAHLRELNRRQQGNRAQPGKRRSYEKKKTEAQSSSRAKMTALSSFLHHADRWEQEDLHAHTSSPDLPWESPWRIERGLEALLQPAHVARWIFRGHKPDGTPKEVRTIEKQHADFLRLLERAEEAGQPLVSEARRGEIAAELARFAVEEEWNVPADATWRAGDEADDETGKWFPTLAEVHTGIAQLQDRFDQARARRTHPRGTFISFWRDARDFVLASCALLCMWRVDTAATIDLSRLARDPQTDTVRWRDGSIHVRLGARAKQTGNRSYFIKDLLIPSEAVDLIEMLLTLERRSLENPLAPEEQAVQLAIGDRWGHDALLDSPREVVPLFRQHPHSPVGLQYEGIARCVESSLFAMGWDAINPHTMRAAGAILWRFVRGRSLAAIMRLGQWTDEKTLTRCYAHMTNEDLDLEIARGDESPHGPADGTPVASVLDDVQRTTLALQQRAPTPVELAAAARLLERAAAALDRAAAALDRAAGTDVSTTFPSKLRDPAHYAELDRKVRALTPDGSGLNHLLGYEVLASPTASRLRAPRQARRTLAQLREQIARSARPA